MSRPFYKYFYTRFFVTCSVLLAVFFVFIYQIIESRRDLARSMGQEAVSHVEIILNNMIEKTDMLEGFLHSLGEDKLIAILENMDGKTCLKEFNLFASMLYDSPAIKSMNLLPQGVMLYSYPLEGNESAIGDRVLEREVTRDAAEYAMQTGLTTIDGPRRFIQGGIAMVARNPIYLSDGSFWGFSAISLSLPEVIEPFGLHDLTRQGYEYHFVMMNQNEAVVVGSTLNNGDLEDCISYSKLISGRRVTLYMIPTSGWLSSLDAAYGFAFFLLLALVIAYLATRNKIASLDLISALEKEKHMRSMTVQAYNEAEQANKAKSNFLSAMSHDLRTPMNAIVGLCSLLTRDTANKQKVAEYARKISASSQHLLGLINDILDMSKIESGKVSVNSREFSLAALVENINTIVRPQAHSRHQAFDIDLHHIDHVLLIGDDLRINQILLNLLSNAVKYTQVGGHIRFEVEEDKMFSNNIASFIFTISDNGMGMSEEFLEHIFEPFARSENVVDTNIQGTGLGMTITNNLVQLLGGTIEIKSKENVGTTITVHLSCQIQNSDEDDAAYFKSKNINNVLIVDDIVGDFISVKNTLEAAEISAHHAFNSEQALEILEQMASQGSKIDLILLDLKLENEDGIEVAKHLGQGKFKDTPILLLSSYDCSEVEIDAIDVGVVGFLSKPLFIVNLKRAIDTMSHKSENHDNKCNKCNLFNGLKILAAEDNELNSEILLDLLLMRGASCRICHDGVEVVEAFKLTSPDDYDLILMDVQMPRLNGLHATEQIRALDLPHAKSIPIIAMTANAFSEDIKASLDAGMNAHVSKPIDFNLLEQCIKELFDKQSKTKQPLLRCQQCPEAPSPAAACESALKDACIGDETQERKD